MNSSSRSSSSSSMRHSDNNKSSSNTEADEVVIRIKIMIIIIIRAVLEPNRVRSGRRTISSASEKVPDFAHESKSVRAHAFQCSYSGKH